MTHIARLIAEGAELLSAAGIDGARRDAQILLANVCGCEPSGLMLIDSLSPEQVAAFHRMIAARSKFQPVSQIIGYREFWGRKFMVSQAVLDPRPETETLIERALAVGGKRILDLGTGSGAIALTLACEIPSAKVTATDVSEAALEIAKSNALRLNVDVDVVQSDWWDNVDGRFDLIVSNPPYIAETEMETLSRDVHEWEPHLALTPGGDGLGPYRIIADGLAEYLTPNGTALFEIGHTQGADVFEIFRAAGWKSVEIFQDMDERNRLVVIKCHSTE